MAHRIGRKREGHPVEALVATHPEQADSAGLKEKILLHRRQFPLALPRGIAATLFRSPNHPAKRSLERLHRMDRRRAPQEGLVLLGSELDRQVRLRAGDGSDPGQGALG